MTVEQEIENIVTGAFNKSPTDIEQAFEKAMATKVTDAIDVKRAEMGVNFSIPSTSDNTDD